MKNKEVALQIEIPEEVRSNLRIRAAQDGITMRACVLRALKKYGIDVKENQIIDKRCREKF